MNNKEIQEMLTVSQWAMWLRYVKKNNVKNEGGRWSDYEFHEFYTSLTHPEVEGEAISEGRSSAKGSEPVVPCDVPEGHGIGEQLELHSYDHVPQRRDAHGDELPLQESGDGPPTVGPSAEPSSGV